LSLMCLSSSVTTFSKGDIHLTIKTKPSRTLTLLNYLRMIQTNITRESENLEEYLYPIVQIVQMRQTGINVAISEGLEFYRVDRSQTQAFLSDFPYTSCVFNILRRYSNQTIPGFEHFQQPFHTVHERIFHFVIIQLADLFLNF